VAQIRLVCWKEDLAAERALLLQKAGLDVDASPFDPAGMITRLKENLPALILIDLDRLPSHGREVAMAILGSKSVRHIPIVFAGGVEEKIVRVKTDVPGGVFTEWAQAAAAVKRALKNPPAVVATPVPHVQRWAGSRLTKKLDLKPGVVALIGPEGGFVETLGELPPGVEFEARITAKTKLALWFVRSARELGEAFELACARLPPGCSLWIIYPKTAGRFRVDFNQDDVRITGLEAGMVDYKICAVDADWSGMKFARRKK
jgi:CheY-like chemotaxis protein